MRQESWLRGPHPVERVSVGEPTVHPFPMRPRPRCRHPAPQNEPETLHPEFDDEPWESQIERVSLSLVPFLPLLERASWQIE